MKPYAALTDWIIPRSLSKDPASFGRAQSLIGFALVAIAFGPCIAAIYGWVFEPLAALPLLAGVFGMAASALSIRFTGNLKVGTIGGIVSMYAVFLFMAWIGGGHPWQSELAWFALVPLVASVVGGHRLGLVWSGVTLLTMVGFTIMRQQGVVFPAGAGRHAHLLGGLLNIAFVGVIVSLGVFFQLAKQQAENQLGAMALFDSLTGLPNRRLLQNKLGEAMARSRRLQLPLAVLFLDLDGFKNVNDRSGHAAGDQVLQIVAERLKACVRETDTVARLAGDEFVVLLERMSLDGSPDQIARKILDKVSGPMQLPGHLTVALGTSIGIALFNGDDQSMEGLLSAADKALYQAKSQGGGRYRFVASSSEAFPT